jgi:hypothetical protein
MIRTGASISLIIHVIIAGWFFFIQNLVFPKSLVLKN